MAIVSKPWQGWGSSRSCLLSDKPILKLLSGEPYFSVEINPIFPNYFLAIWNNSREVLCVVRNQVILTFFLTSPFRITLNKSFCWKYWSVLSLTKYLWFLCLHLWLLGKRFRFMITWCFKWQCLNCITSIVCLLLCYISFRNARKHKQSWFRELLQLGHLREGGCKIWKLA